MGKPGDRQGFYQLAPNPYARGLRGAIEPLSKARRVVTTARAKIPKTSRNAHKKLRKMEGFYTKTVAGLEEIIEDL